MKEDDPYNLERFLIAQAEDYNAAIHELRLGRKKTHWIWYVFPQVAGLGSSSMSQDYAIKSCDEAVAYLNHPILGMRLRECCEVLLSHKESEIEDVMGFPDNLKLQSSMTLFALISDRPNDFQVILDTFYEGESDKNTVSFLRS